MNWCYCPQEGCGLPSLIEEFYSLWATDGPFEHAKIRCIAGHWFNCPTEMLTFPSDDSLLD